MKLRGKQWKGITGIIILLTCVLFFFPTAQASGILMYETGTPAVGLGSAGNAAGAFDASTLYYNPAGMMRLGKSEYLTGAQVLLGYTKFQPGPDMTITGSSGYNFLGWLPGATFYYVNSVNSRTKVGFGSFANFGMVVPNKGDWPGRYAFQGGAMVGLTFMPSIAYRMNDRWSVGMALNATYGIWNVKAAINNRLDAMDDGSVRLSDNKWGFGANVGLLYEADKKTRFGLTYNSPVSLAFSAAPYYTNLGPALETILRERGLYGRKVDMGVKIPQQVMLGFAREVDSRWTIMGDVGWQDWSNFGYKQVTIDSTTPTAISIERRGQDTWHAALGAKYKASPKWTLTFGVSYDTSAFNAAERPLFMPIGDSWRFGVGASTEINPTTTLNFGYEALLSGTIRIDQQGGDLAGRIQGTFARGVIHFFTVNYRRKF